MNVPVDMTNVGGWVTLIALSGVVGLGIAQTRQIRRNTALLREHGLITGTKVSLMQRVRASLASAESLLTMHFATGYITGVVAAGAVHDRNWLVAVSAVFVGVFAGGAVKRRIRRDAARDADAAVRSGVSVAVRAHFDPQADQHRAFKGHVGS